MYAARVMASRQRTDDPEVYGPEILATVLNALKERNGIATAEVDDVIWGCSAQRGKQGSCIARMSLLAAGWDTRASGVTLDRFCGSGITSVNMAAASIMSGMEDLVVAGGVEMLSYTARLAGQGGGAMLDAGNLALREPHPQPHQGVCAAGSPELMLNEPVPAVRKVLKKAGMTLNDIDLFEVNEAFAVVAFKFMRDLDLDPARVNVNGGAIALGHPIAGTGSILIGTLLDELERRDLTTGLVTMCAAGGMAPAIVIERI
ncbi:MAG: beta-ketoacyl synthase N-terminal-like domain-containing protein [Pseudomonadales bacterium]